MRAAHRNKPSGVGIHHFDWCLFVPRTTLHQHFWETELPPARGSVATSGKLAHQKAGGPDGVGVNGTGDLPWCQERR